jgi:voltage-gated potassium channel
MRFTERRIQRSFETGRILWFVMASITTLVVVFGVVMWLVDRDDFPTLGLALWWSVQTVTTVGYGDAVPANAGGRFLATGLMIIGFASLSLLTGIIASLLVYRRTSAQGSGVDRIEDRLAEIERLLRAERGE